MAASRSDVAALCLQLLVEMSQRHAAKMHSQIIRVLLSRVRGQIATLRGLYIRAPPNFTSLELEDIYIYIYLFIYLTLT